MRRQGAIPYQYIAHDGTLNWWVYAFQHLTAASAFCSESMVLHDCALEKTSGFFA
jgi:hypothetical protein